MKDAMLNVKKKIETNGIIAKQGFRCLVMVRKEAYIHPQKVVFSLWNCLIFTWSWDPFKGYESFDVNYKYISLVWILVIRSIDCDSSSTFKIMGLNIKKEKKEKKGLLLKHDFKVHASHAHGICTCPQLSRRPDFSIIKPCPFLRVFPWTKLSKWVTKLCKDHRHGHVAFFVHTDCSFG